LTHPYSILLLVTALTSVVLAVYALRYIRSPGTFSYSAIMVCLSLYSLGYAFELQADDMQQILFWLHAEYLAISFLPPLFLILAINYTGKSHLLKPWLVVPLFLIGFTTLIFQLTNYDNLFYRDFKLNTETSLVLADFAKGPWYWVHQAFANLTILASAILYLNMYLNTFGRNRNRALIMLLALGIPWIFYLVYLAGGSPYNIDLSPFSFSVTGILTALGIFRYNLLEYIPVALENVFNSMTTGVVILDEDKCLINYNPSALEVLPELPAFKKGKPADRLFEGSHLAELREGNETDLEILRQGKTTYYHLKVVDVKTVHGKSGGWALIFSNITDRKLKEIELLHIEKNLKELIASKDRFFAIIAHDLRNAFHLIINMSDMIVNNLEQGNTASALTKSRIIQDTAVNTYDLLQNLLEWALMQLKGIQFNPVDLRLIDVVTDVIDNLKTQADQKDIHLDNQVDKKLEITGDQEMLKTVIRNLISNAIKYSNKGGFVKIDAAVINNMADIRVNDNGTGMSREEQEKLFSLETYFTKKGTASENGTGLGLRLCKEFVKMHQGDIRVKSMPGLGSTFSFTVPLAGETAGMPPEMPSPAHPTMD